MNYTDVMNALKNASLFDLFRLAIAISHELENPDRIKAAKQAFKVGDTVSFFDEKTNALQSGIVIEKNLKYVVLQDARDQYHLRKMPYCYLNLDKVSTDIHCQQREKLSKNNLKIGDCVGFNKDGEQIVGVITRLNFKTVSLITVERRRWRVGYVHLYKIIDTELAKRFAELSVNR
jgi:hypothetical protein